MIIHTLILYTFISVLGAQRTVNKAPIWVEDLAGTLGAGIMENTKVGTKIGTLLATDPEGSEIEYFGNSETLNVDMTSGDVTLARVLDREAMAANNVKFIRVSFFAQEKFGVNSVEAKVSMVVLDYNDNAPHFVNTPYTVQVKEGTAVGSVIYDQVSVTDNDVGFAAQISVQCYIPSPFDIEAQQACDTFNITTEFTSSDIGRAKVQIHLQKPLNYETTKSYIMTLFAKDNGMDIKLNSTVNVLIVVVDEQDRPPVFVHVPVTFYIDEDAPVNSKVGDIIVQDGDEGVLEIQDIKITLFEGSFFRNDTDPGMFHLGRSVLLSNVSKVLQYTAPVYTSKPLDREKNARYEFKVKAIEMEQGIETAATAITTIGINIMDVNDNAPTFENSSYPIDVQEVKDTTGFKTLQLAIRVYDLDEIINANFSVSVVSETFPGSVIVFPSTSVINAANFYISVANKYLDYETVAYRTQHIVLKAQELGTAEMRSSSATVTINLQPINDHSPKFDLSEYEAFVTENQLPTQPIITITAKDADTPGDRITYSLHGAHSSWFRVVPSTGEIFLLQALDYEETQTLQLVYMAVDGTSSALKGTTHLKIHVKNVNDVPPKFTPSEYHATVKETSMQLLPVLIIVATDLETGSSFITYKIIRGNTADNAFVIDERSGSLTLTRLVTWDEATNGKFILVVQASDNGSPNLSSFVHVTISVTDENIHDPIFDNLVYRANVNETAPIGGFVLQISAHDRDQGINGKIRYKILNQRDKFQVDESTGIITVRAPLNHNDRHTYTLRAQAIDSASPPREGFADIIITVLDQNNEPPKFNEKVYSIAVEEEWVRPRTLLTVDANDTDSDNDLVYSILPGTIVAMDSGRQPFTDTNTYDYKHALAIRPTNGEIYINTYLSYKHVARFSFTVQVEDKSSVTNRQIDTAPVTITVIETVDMRPTFEKPWQHNNPNYLFTILEEGPRGSAVTTLVATEKRQDKTEIPITNFEKFENSDPKNYFTVIKTTGEIVINEPIDFEALPNKLLTFQVKAISADGSKYSVARLSIQVNDINDHVPVFTPSEGYKFSIAENSPYPTEVGRVQAEDGDSGQYAKLTFSIIGHQAQHFAIYDNGLITVAKNAIIDRETKREYNLKIEARDNPGGEDFMSTKVTLKITIKDTNDNKPKFSQSNYTFYMVDSLPPHTSIGQVAATDPDEFNNGQFYFIAQSVRNNNASQLIAVNPTTGVVTTQDDPSRYAFTHTLPFDVTAIDLGRPPQTSTVRMTIIRDTRATDGKPIFKFPSKGTVYGDLSENVPLGTGVTKVRALSARGTNYTIQYSFIKGTELGLNDDYKYFLIDKDSGEITVKGKLDREFQQDYELRIRANDSTAQPATTSVEQLIIRLKDENDNRPVFGQAPCSAEFTSNQTKQVFVKENSAAGTEVVVVSACDRDIYPNNQITYSLNVEEKGCERNLFQVRIGESSVIETTGIILDYEAATEHYVCIEATDNFPGAKPDITYVLVNVLDVNDNGPIFTQKHYTTVILDTISRGVTATQLTATDKDQGENAKVLYNILSTKFYYKADDPIEHPESFVMNPLTGQLTTAMSPYTDFTGGHFVIQVIAYDYHDNSMSDIAQVTVMVIDETNKVMVVMTTGKDEVADASFRDKWKQKLNESLQQTSKWDLSITEVKYHKDDQDKIDTQRIDMCFVATNNTGQYAISGERVRDVLTSSYTFSRSSEVSVQRCTTYKRQDDMSPYWWVLVAFAIFIFICCLILIAIFAILSNRFKRQQESTSIQMIPSS